MQISQWLYQITYINFIRHTTDKGNIRTYTVYVATVQLNLNFNQTCHCMRVCTFTPCKTWKIWCTNAFLHAILVCACLPVNTHNTWVIHIMNLHLIGLPYYMCGVRTGIVDTYVYTTKCISFADGQLLIVFCYWQNIWACPH